MTNREKFKEIFDKDMHWSWLNSEYEEPTTKNNLGVDCVDRREVINRIFYSTDNSGDVVLGSALRERIEKLPSVTPTSKECVDCVSRADAIKAMQDKAKKLTNEDTINGLCGAVAILFDLPSVTPIRPKGHWITETPRDKRHLGSRNGYCSVCKDFYTDDWDIMNYCPNCGSDNREVEE